MDAPTQLESINLLANRLLRLQLKTEISGAMLVKFLFVKLDHHIVLVMEGMAGKKHEARSVLVNKKQI